MGKMRRHTSCWYYNVLKCSKILAEGIPLCIPELYIFLWILPRREMLWKYFCFPEVKDIYFFVFLILGNME